MFGDLVLAGILQGYWWGSLQPWDVSIDGSRPFWIFRVFAGLTMFAGQLCFFYNIYRTCEVARCCARSSTIELGRRGHLMIGSNHV